MNSITTGQILLVGIFLVLMITLIGGCTVASAYLAPQQQPMVEEREWED